MKSFRLNIVIRVAVIAALSVGFGWVVTNTNWFFTPTIIGIVWLVLVFNLIIYIERTNKDLTSFLLNIRQRNYTSSIASGNMGKSFSHLSGAFNDVINELEKLNFERETHYQYLQTLTENMGVGIISYDLSGTVHLANPEAKRLLQVMRLPKIDALKQVHPKLYETVTKLHSGEKQLLHLPIGSEVSSLSVHSKELKLNDTTYRVVLLQDLRNELEAREVEAWQKLIRVLTHEIMNSVTPIVTLSEAVNRIVKNSDGKHKTADELDQESLGDVYDSLSTIENRSKGLLRFVNAYKDFSKTQEVKLSKNKLSVIIDSVTGLLKPELEERRIGLDVVVSDLYILADAGLVEQVLINVIRNAMDALTSTERGKIVIRSNSTNTKVSILVSDNGPGIESELMEKIFVPFFTTKKTGTGIGLSWSRQIMRLHGGNLVIKSKPRSGTQVEMEFRNS